MEFVHLAKRHGTAIHSHTAIAFACFALLLLALYSILALLGRRVRLIRKLTNIISSPLTLFSVWVLLLTYAIFHHFSSDFLQIARRYGQLAIACATLSVVLSFKPAIFPFTQQIVLVSIHKWIGRTSILLAFVHGIIYFTSYLKAMRSSSSHSTSHTTTEDAELVTRHNGEHHSLFTLFNVFGMVALVAFITMFFTSLGPVRRRVYYLFYALHRPLAILVYIMMIWHARPSAWILVTAGLLLMTFQIVFRLTMSRNFTIETVTTYGRDLQLIEFSPPIQDHRIKSVGSHVRVSRCLHSPTVFFQSSHPYTLVSPNQLVVRETSFKLAEGQAYSMYGPFDSSNFDVSSYSHFIVIAGGSGVSMLPRFATSTKMHLFIWITRNSQETTILPKIGVNECEVFITGGSNSESDDFELQEFEIDSDRDNDDDDDSQSQILLGGATKHRSGINRHRGRPDFTKTAEPFLRVAGDDTNSRICVVACGPESLVRSAQAWAFRQKLDIWGEAYML